MEITQPSVAQLIKPAALIGYDTVLIKKILWFEKKTVNLLANRRMHYG